MSVPGVDVPDPTSLAAAQFQAPFILTNVLKQLTKMTSVLQKAAAAQAGGLTLLSAWQKAYTELMVSIPSGPPSSIWFYTSTVPSIAEERANLLRTMGNLSSILQNRQSIISDIAKAAQSAVNQTNDAVNTQSNAGTSFLQESQTLLGSIFK